MSEHNKHRKPNLELGGISDVLNASQRSYCMSRIRNKNTKPEILLRKALWAVGLRYRLKNKLFGKPDIVFPGAKIAVFVDGCFWHGCPKHSNKPKNNSDFWEKKIKGNILRDQRVNDELKKEGWLVLRFWEHEIKENIYDVTQKILDSVKK